MKDYFKYVILWLFFLPSLNSYSDTVNWDAAAPIGNPVANSLAIFTAPIFPNQFVATWAASSPLGQPVYSIYDGTSWSSAEAITTDNTRYAFINIYSSANLSGNVLATWTNKSTHYPFYSIYNGSSWSVPSAISTLYTSANDVYSSAISSTQFLATWVNRLSSTPYYGIPYYSIFDGSAWSNPLPIINSILIRITTNLIP